MSHELRTPLNAILGFAQLITHNNNLSSEDKENLEIISRSGEHLLTLINQVLDLSKIEAGRVTLNETNFNLHLLLDDLENMFSLKAEEKDLQLIFERSLELPQYIRTDEVKLRQVLINLLNNAIKFTSSGGIALLVYSAINDLDVKNQLITIHFEVEDTGAGIAPKELEKLFQAFVQTETGKQAQEGTGLGLVISRQFVQLMGGEITVTSEVGKGSKFEFEIPVKLPQSNDIQNQQPSHRIISLEPNQPTYKILIVDNEWRNRKLLLKLLNPLGFELKEASNGTDAIEICKQWEPNLILMDIRMPVMDGYQATQQIKSSNKGEATAIIAITASSFEEEKSLVISAGCDDFLRKPFREEDLFNIISKHLNVRYLYEDSLKAKIIPSESISQIDLAVLPQSWSASLHRATLEGDIELIQTLIEEIRPENEILAEFLADLATQYDFEMLLSFTEVFEI